MSFFDSKKNVGHETSPDIPESFFSAVRTMKDDLEGKPEQRLAAIRTENKEVNPFSPDFSAAVPTMKPSEQQNSSPFAAPQDAVSLPQDKPTIQAPVSGGVTFQEGSVMQGGSHDRSSTRKMLLMVGIALISLALLGAAAYYFLILKGKSDQSSESIGQQPEPIVDILPEEVKHQTEPPIVPFALDKPNYLSIDVETATAADIRKVFDQAAMRIVGATMNQPVEFLVTDKNNNPIAFSRFAFIGKLELSADLLSLIEESFSVFAYNDAGTPRFGLVLSFKDPVLASQRVTKEEEKIPYELRAFLYGDGPVVSQKSVFRSGTYGTQSVRFVNIDAARGVSFDYMVRDKRWIIGSSKDTLRAIADAYQK